MLDTPNVQYWKRYSIRDNHFKDISPFPHNIPTYARGRFQRVEINGVSKEKRLQKKRCVYSNCYAFALTSSSTRYFSQVASCLEILQIGLACVGFSYTTTAFAGTPYMLEPNYLGMTRTIWPSNRTALKTGADLTCHSKLIKPLGPALGQPKWALFIFTRLTPYTTHLLLRAIQTLWQSLEGFERNLQELPRMRTVHILHLCWNRGLPLSFGRWKCTARTNIKKPNKNSTRPTKSSINQTMRNDYPWFFKSARKNGSRSSWVNL